MRTSLRMIMRMEVRLGTRKFMRANARPMPRPPVDLCREFDGLLRVAGHGVGARLQGGDVGTGCVQPQLRGVVVMGVPT